MANPIWRTASNLGTYENNTVINTVLVAAPVPPAVGVSYEVTNGSLPSGFTLTINGSLTGILTTTFTDNQMNFSVTATDNLGNSATRTFIITALLTPQQPTWTTPTGSIGNFPADTITAYQFDASAVLPATSITYRLLSGSLPPGL